MKQDEYIVELENRVWISSRVKIKPRRTTLKKSAHKFKTEFRAAIWLLISRLYFRSKFEEAKIIKVK